MRCPDCGGYKHNPDENLRRLEQAASSGDIYAARKLSLEKHRRRLCEDEEDHCWQCQVFKMKNSNAYKRWWATEALGNIGDPAAIPALVETMQNDSDRYVRHNAARALGYIGDSAAIPALVEMMKNESDSYVRSKAVEVLEKISHIQKSYKRNPDENLRRLEQAASSGDIYAARKLSLEKHRRRLCREGKDCCQCQINALKNSNLFVHGRDVHWWAVDTLGEIGDPTAISALVEAMRTGESYIRYKAVWALERIKDPSTISAFIEEMQNNSDYRVRGLSAAALGKIGDPAVIPVLVKTMKNDSNRYVQQMADEALEDISEVLMRQMVAEALEDIGEEL